MAAIALLWLFGELVRVKLDYSSLLAVNWNDPNHKHLLSKQLQHYHIEAFGSRYTWSTHERAAKRQFVEVKPRIDLSPKEITTNVDRFFYRWHYESIFHTCVDFKQCWILLSMLHAVLLLNIYCMFTDLIRTYFKLLFLLRSIKIYLLFVSIFIKFPKQAFGFLISS